MAAIVPPGRLARSQTLGKRPVPETQPRRSAVALGRTVRDLWAVRKCTGEGAQELICKLPLPDLGEALLRSVNSGMHLIGDMF